MDKQIAKQIAEDKLNEIISGEQSEIIGLLVESESEFVNKDGVEYQVKRDAFYDDKEKKIIRVCVSVDDQKFWSIVVPLRRSELVNE